jgi:hypothetical protein
MTTPLEAAKKKFAPGTPVNIKPDTVARASEKNDLWELSKYERPVAVRVVGFRDSDDDPIVCVCIPNPHGAIAGWFPAECLRVASGAWGKR